MKQDVIIRWLMENIDAEQLARANENGSTIAYYAGVAQRFPQNEQTANTQPRRNNPTVAEDRDEQTNARRQPTRQPATTTAVDLNQNENANPPTRQPARRTTRQTQTGEDRVRVGQY